MLLRKKKKVYNRMEVRGKEGRERRDVDLFVLVVVVVVNVSLHYFSLDLAYPI